MHSAAGEADARRVAVSRSAWRAATSSTLTNLLLALTLTRSLTLSLILTPNQVGGNLFYTAQPLGVRDGIDLGSTGEV